METPAYENDTEISLLIQKNAELSKKVIALEATLKESLGEQQIELLTAQYEQKVKFQNSRISHLEKALEDVNVLLMDEKKKSSSEIMELRRRVSDLECTKQILEDCRTQLMDKSSRLESQLESSLREEGRLRTERLAAEQHFDHQIREIQRLCQEHERSRDQALAEANDLRRRLQKVQDASVEISEIGEQTKRHVLLLQEEVVRGAGAVDELLAAQSQLAVARENLVAFARRARTAVRQGGVAMSDFLDSLLAVEDSGGGEEGGRDSVEEEESGLSHGPRDDGTAPLVPPPVSA
eukprot:CAMPEP_0175076816 /NCGR_PEP_ID=MMETSP0052_2-20121109/22981_1 /TAXON_ID=51329 ORGANISM="Polytomella parva, Strain SAG 63-3" /NCGR_SAMPLE_ID=MMETSP0052_2 /ASSEMBLY_ACC=CAM_ASM_000194 /LENGTH=293 /DNA_ID=CAMNT_0016346085 /DNA_START=87 /DNA_END=964 /DNA_ORIENTATION=+